MVPILAEPASSPLTTLAEPTFNWVLAVIVPLTKDVLAIMVAILAEPASIPLTTLAEPTLSWVLAVIVPPNKDVLAIMVPILAEPASKRLTTLAEPTFSSVLAVIVPLIMDVLATKPAVTIVELATRPAVTIVELATKPAVTTPVLATKAAVVIPVLATILPTCRRDVNASVVVMYELELRDITYALLDVYNVAVFTNTFAEIDLALTAPATFAQPALISKFAVKFCV